MISARLVDPRDVTLEVGRPTYRVTFWSQPPPPPGVPAGMLGWASSEWDVEGGGVDEVLDWARDAPGRTGPTDRVSVAVLLDRPGNQGRTAIWLLGDDPTVNSPRRPC